MCTSVCCSSHFTKLSCLCFTVLMRSSTYEYCKLTIESIILYVNSISLLVRQLILYGILLSLHSALLAVRLALALPTALWDISPACTHACISMGAAAAAVRHVVTLS